jgi:haloalkane dehalogenase
VISGAFPFQKQGAEILAQTMAYVDVGQGDPIVLLHGNPTSSYLWRNIIPYLQGLGGRVAPDLIGMGDSAKLPSSGPAAYTFVEHRRYLDGLLDRLGVNERVTFVIHDWGSALGFDWANRHRRFGEGPGVYGGSGAAAHLGRLPPRDAACVRGPALARR